jgi:hypothetical protein
VNLLCCRTSPSRVSAAAAEAEDANCPRRSCCRMSSRSVNAAR